VAVAPVKSRRAPLRERLLRQLADGEFHSGAVLARSLGVSRTAVWKAVRALGALDIDVHAVPKRGYQLPQRVELLDARAITRALPPASRSRLRALECHLRIDSTNSRLLEIDDLPHGRADVCLAELQAAGRGRRGRSWLASFGAGICLSISWQFAEVPRQLSALSLAIGVRVLRALRGLGAEGLGVKWPNDLLAGQRKLGGILIELRAESGGPAYVVIGIGINYLLTSRLRRELAAADVQAAGLSETIAGRRPGRNRVVSALLDRLLEALVEFERNGLEPFAREWRSADALAAAHARVAYGDQTYSGIARGIDEDGALLLETPGRLLRFISGEVTVRAETRA
jgi:BirA family biotin operon repressor/biotin-[acetyl-CoA-carboxylase] ligase